MVIAEKPVSPSMAQNASKNRAWADYPGTRRYTDAELEEVSTVDTALEDEPIAILAEDITFTLRGSDGDRQSSTRVRYLTQYAGKSILESSWEPAFLFKNGGEFLINQWNVEKAKRDRGESPPFDVDDFERQSKPLRDKALERKRKRDEKKAIQKWIEEQATANEPPPCPVSRQTTSENTGVSAAEPQSQNSLFDGELPVPEDAMDVTMAGHSEEPAAQVPAQPEPPKPNASIPFESDTSDDSDDSDDMPLIRRRRSALPTRAKPSNDRPAESPEPGEVFSRDPTPPARLTSQSSTSEITEKPRKALPKVIVPMPRSDVEVSATTFNSPVGPKPTKKKDSDIFKNWDADVGKRRSWLTKESSTPQSYATFQQKTWTKRSNEKHAPAPPLPDQPPISPMDMSDIQSPIDKIAQETIRPVERVSTEITSPVIPTYPKPIPRPAQPETAEEDEGELLTCWFWANGRPCYPECVFEHTEGFEVAPAGNDLRENKQYACCPFHAANGYCYRAADACWYAHSPKKYLGPAKKFSRVERSRWHPVQKAKPLQSASAGRPESWEALGCWFYNRGGGCTKSENQCLYAHRYTRFVATRSKETGLIYQADGGVYERGTLQKMVPTDQLPEFSQPDHVDEGVHMEVDDEVDPPADEVSEVKASFEVQTYGQVSGTQFSCRLEFEDHAACKRFSSLFNGTSLHLRCQYACRTDDAVSWTRLCPELSRLKGTFYLDSQAVVDTLTMRDMAAVCLVNGQPLFISPYMNVHEGESPLEFCFCDCKLDIPRQGQQEAIEAGRSAFDKILNGENDRSKPKQIMIIFDHVQKEEQAQKLVTYFQGQDIKVYTSDVPGSWNYFCSNVKDGTVLFQSEFLAWSEVRGLKKLLSVNTRFFRLGPGLSGDWMHEPLKRIFPNGIGVLITDDCLTDYAEETLPAIVQLARRASFPNARCFIIARPGFQAWLLNLIAARRDAGDEASALCKIRDHLWEMHAISASSELNTPDDLGFEWGPRVALVEPSADHLPDFDAAMDADERTATTHLVEWFGSWAASRASGVRRFVVLSMHRKQWKDAWEARLAHVSCYKPGEFVRVETERNAGGAAPRKG